MANRKREVYKPKPITEGKRNLIQGLLQEYNIPVSYTHLDVYKRQVLNYHPHIFGKINVFSDYFTIYSDCSVCRMHKSTDAFHQHCFS